MAEWGACVRIFGDAGSPAASQRNHLCNEVVPWAHRFVPVTSFLPWKNNRQTVVMELGSLWNIFLKKKKTERIESVISKRTIANVWCQRPKPNLYTIIRLLKKMHLCYCGFDSISKLNVFFSWVCCLYWFKIVIFEIVLWSAPTFGRAAWLSKHVFSKRPIQMLQYRGHAAAGR